MISGTKRFDSEKAGVREVAFTCSIMCVISGTKRFDSEKAGDREVQRTMLELLNQLDGFQPNHDIKVAHASLPGRLIWQSLL